MNPFIWLGVAVVMALAEVISLGLITVWFFVGALLAFFVALFGGSVVVQLVVFFAVSAVCLVLLRPVFIKYRRWGAREEQSFVGGQAVVTEEVNNALHTGRVETENHMTWSARSADGSVLPVGTSVVVVGQKSIRLIVERRIL